MRKLQFVIKNIKSKAVKFLKFLVIKALDLELDPDPQLEKMLDPDPDPH
jgi:hypothetical protein